ncbi:hypothetical protein GCM10009096_32650 [Parasphingorhabdus litoris]|uniref:Uncharacterized protein n=1 Tax=Parasphingorhabdus litoris TaxID=394733 RepID=A0ABN1AZM3_9SPHN
MAAGFPTSPKKAKAIAALAQLSISALHIASACRRKLKRGCDLCELWLEMAWRKRRNGPNMDAVR